MGFFSFTMLNETKNKAKAYCEKRRVSQAKKQKGESSNSVLEISN
jgi:hypothetical protein